MSGARGRGRGYRPSGSDPPPPPKEEFVEDLLRGAEDANAEGTYHMVIVGKLLSVVEVTFWIILT